MIPKLTPRYRYFEIDILKIDISISIFWRPIFWDWYFGDWYFEIDISRSILGLLQSWYEKLLFSCRLRNIDTGVYYSNCRLQWNNPKISDKTLMSMQRTTPLLPEKHNIDIIITSLASGSWVWHWDHGFGIRFTNLASGSQVFALGSWVLHRDHEFGAVINVYSQMSVKKYQLFKRRSSNNGSNVNVKDHSVIGMHSTVLIHCLSSKVPILVVMCSLSSRSAFEIILHTKI